MKNRSTRSVLKLLKRQRASASRRFALTCGLTGAVASMLLGSHSAQAQQNDAYSVDATSGLFSSSFTLGTNTPTTGGASSPASGDSLFFGTETTGTTTVSNDLTGLSFTALTFNSGASAFTIGGNAFILTGGITNAGTAVETFSNAIAISGANVLALTNGTATTGAITLNGNLTGSGALSQTGVGTGVTAVNFGGNNSGFTGTFTQDNASSTRTAFAAAMAGSAAAAWTFNRAINGGVALNFGTGTISFGSLAGGGFIRNNVAATTSTLSVGALNTSTTFSGSIQANGTDLIALTKVGTGSLTLSGANTYTGDTIISGGALILANGASISGSTLQYNNQGGTLGFGTGTSATLGGLNGAQNLALTNDVSAGVTLTVGSNNAATTYSGVLSGTGGALTKSGTGTLTLSGANTYTGPTQVSAGTLSLSGTGSVASSAITVGAAGAGSASSLNLAPSVTSGTITRGTSLSVNGSNLTGNNAHNVLITPVAANTNDQFTGALNLNSGGTFLGFSAASTGGNTVVTFGSLTRNTGTVLNAVSLSGGPGGTIGGATSSDVVFGAAPTLTGGGGAAGTTTVSILPYAYVGNSLATYDATNGLRALSSATEMATLASGMAAGQNAKVAANTTLNANTSVNSLYGTAGTISFASDATSLNVTSGAVAANVGYTIGSGVAGGNGILNFGTAEGFLHVSNTRSLTVNSAIAGSGGLTVDLTDANATTANAILAGANTYTGTTTFDGNNAAMTVRLTNSLALQNTTLDYNNYGASFTFGNGTTTGQTAYTFGGLKGAQNINLNNNNTTVGAVALTVGGDGDSTTYSGILSNTVAGGSLIKTGAGTLTLTGANTYSGGTTVSGGTLSGTTTSLQGAITNNATLDFTQSTNGTYAGNISGTGVVTKNGTGNVTLTGTNTYSGGTTVSGGTLTGNTTSLQGAITDNATVTFSQTTNGTYAGNISGTGTVTKAGTGTVTFTGTDTAALTTLSAGTLALGANNRLSSTSNVTLTGGTLSIANASGSPSFSQGTSQNGATVGTPEANGIGTTAATFGAGTLSVQGGVSTLDFGAGNTGGVFAFSSYDFTSTGILNIINYTGNPFDPSTLAAAAGGGTDQLFFGGNGQTEQQLLNVYFINPSGITGTYQARLLSTGEVVAPEPSQWAALLIGALGLGGLAVRARRRASVTA